MRTLLFVLLVLVSFSLSAQGSKSCCTLGPSQEFAMLSTGDDFKNLHAAPLPYVYNEDIGRMVRFKTTDGEAAYGFEILTAYKSDKWLLVFHEWWGLNDYMKKEAVKYFQQLKDVNILVVDLYDGKVATTADAASALMTSLNDTRARNIIQGAIKYAGKSANIATLGWCMGGTWSLQATLMAGEQATGAVMYYGMPERDVEKLKTLKVDVLFVFAAKDDYINRDVLNNFEANMKVAPGALLVKEYDAVHAFANPSNPNYDAVAAEDAFIESTKFLSKRFFQKEEKK